MSCNWCKCTNKSRFRQGTFDLAVQMDRIAAIAATPSLSRTRDGDASRPNAESHHQEAAFAVTGPDPHGDEQPLFLGDFMDQSTPRARSPSAADQRSEIQDAGVEDGGSFSEGSSPGLQEHTRAKGEKDHLWLQRPFRHTLDLCRISHNGHFITPFEDDLGSLGPRPVINLDVPAKDQLHACDQVLRLVMQRKDLKRRVVSIHNGRHHARKWCLPTLANFITARLAQLQGSCSGARYRFQSRAPFLGGMQRSSPGSCASSGMQPR